MPNDGYNAATNQNDNWRTPDWLFKALDCEFAFNLDAAADATNSKCSLFSSDIDTLVATDSVRAFCNPPYSNIMPFVTTALECGLWVFILPVRTRSEWFELLDNGRHDGCVEFRWLRKRIEFDVPVGGYIPKGETAPVFEAESPRMDTFIAVVRAIK